MRYLFSFIQKAIELFCRNKNGAKIFMFHQVNDDKNKWIDSGVCIRKKGFVEFIDRLSANKSLFLSVAELNAHVDRKSVFLTFDDVFEDAVENAFPYLVERGIPFCVFISDSNIDRKDFIATEQIKQLVKEPLCTIGYHTKSHRLMRFLSKEQIVSELDCRSLENVIDRKIDYFAFPYGSVYACSKESIDVAKKMSYRYVFSTISIPCTSSWIINRPFFLPRINVNERNYKKLLKQL